MLENEIGSAIAAEMHIRPKQAEATIKLLDEGNTVPFISRYRKEATGELDEEQVRTVEERLTYLRNLVKRQQEVLTKIEEQDKLTDELRTAIEKTSICRIWRISTCLTSKRNVRGRRLHANAASSRWQQLSCCRRAPREPQPKRRLLL